MATKNNRLIDHQGRVVLPTHIRNALNLQPGNVVQVELDDEGTIRIRPVQERCCLCGETVGENYIPLTTGPDRKLICKECGQKVAKEMLG